MEFEIPAMSCGHCAGVITETVKRLDPEATVSVDLQTRKVSVQTTQERPALAQALAQAGYPAR